MVGRDQVTSIVWAVVAVTVAFVLAGVALDTAGSKNTVAILSALFGGLVAITALFVAVLKMLGFTEIRAGVKEATVALNGNLKPRLVDAATDANEPIVKEIQAMRAELAAMKIEQEQRHKENTERLAKGDKRFDVLHERMDMLTHCEVEPQ